MKTKKSTQANLENKKKSFFLFGLVTALSFIFMAFEWAAFDVQYQMPQYLGPLAETEPAVTMIEIERPKPRQTVPPKTTRDIIDKVIIDNNIKDDSTQVIKLPPSDLIGAVIIDTNIYFGEPDAPIIHKVFKVVEEMPSYGKEEKDLFVYLSKKIKYTQYARELGIEGIVYVQFVVEKDGTITDVTLVRGIEAGLDQMALNTIINMGTWNPGKQRGKAVRVQQVIPIRFQLK